MKKIGLKKIILIIILIAMFLYIGTFFHINDIQANTYEAHNPWYGHDLDFQEINSEEIIFDSLYRPFSTISTNANLASLEYTYIIESAEDLYMFSTLNNGEDHDVYRRLNYALGRDIDYYDLLVLDSSKTFEPIGFRYPFLGTFDGQGFEITNLYLEPILDAFVYESKYLGLTYLSMFSHVGTTGVIKNIGLINPLVIQPIEWGAMKYVSALVGLNEGHIHHTYYIDTRSHQAGFNAEGAFHLAGLVSKNIGILEESYVASPHIKGLSVLENLSTAPIFTENSGTISNVYYDQEILTDPDTTYQDHVGLNTIDFQNAIYFDNNWFFNNHYESLTSDTLLKPQYRLDHLYPILQGLEVGSDKLYISDAIDLMYMNDLLYISNLFRSEVYEINHDIDMNQVAFDAYQQASIGFNGKLTSSMIDDQSILYPRSELQGGNQVYHSIIGLNITKASYVSEQAIYGLFSVLFGTVEHINFIDTTIITSDIDETYERDQMNIGVIAGQTVLGVIDDVHVDLSIEITSSALDVGNIALGGLVGGGSGEITKSSTNGLIVINEQIYQSKLDQSAFSGIVGKTENMSLDEILSAVEVRKNSYSNSALGTSYVGGVVGYGSINYMNKIVSKTSIYLDSSFDHNHHFIGGVFGYIADVESQISNLYHKGNIEVYIDQAMDIDINGIGYVLNDDINSLLASITNYGDITLTADQSLDQQSLQDMNINVSLGLTINGRATIYGLYQTKGQLIDLSVIKTFSGALTHIGDNPLEVTKVYQNNNIMFQTSSELTQLKIKLSGVILGGSMNYEHIRQKGHLSLDITHASTINLNGDLHVYGMFETISDTFYGKELYQGGNITVSKNESVDVSYDLYISGVGYAHENIDHYELFDIDPTSIEITDQKGSFDTVLSNADITVNGHFDGMVFTSGILLYNYGLLTNAINLGDINIINDISSLDDRIEASGIVYQLVGRYARVKDAANNGDIKVVSNTNLGYAHASGIVLRNDKLIDGTDVVAGNDHKYAKILFSINYGDIYAYNHSDESSYSITTETRSKASGILAIGLLTAVNNINYGNIYSNHLASGIIGFIYLNKFGTLGYDEVYISNAMNYGKVREITAYDPMTESLTIDMNQTPSDLAYQAFGAIVGKIHTGTSTWAFAGDVDYPIDRIYFGYLLNFDEKIDMFSSAPPLSSSWQDFFGGDTIEANNVILNMQKYMATTNPDDQSVAPFTYFYAGGFFGQYLGKQIEYYDISDSETGMFFEDFAFRSKRPSYSGTDQYILDYISYIPRDKTNLEILSRIESSTIHTYPGIYALSSSSGIDNGIFIPDNFETLGLGEYLMDTPESDQTYLGDPENTDSISYHLYVDMRQIKMDYATTIYDLEIIQVDQQGQVVNNALSLKDPVIDEKRSLITYYLPSNASILLDQTPDILNVESFVEVSPGVENARKVLNQLGTGEPEYTWVGTHKKSGNQMELIGPYKETGIYDLSSDMISYDSNTRSEPVYSHTGAIYDTVGAVNAIFEHEPHILTVVWIFNFWNATGYQVTASEPQTGGYAPYEPYILNSSYPTLYNYVGPSTEPVTYVQSTPISGVSVYDPADVYFAANTNEGSYQISQNASFSYENETLSEVISIPRSYGVYDLMSYQGEYIDSVEDHYGSIRVYSNAYNENDPATYKDYEIRVIRTANESLTDITELSVNKEDALSPLDLTTNVTSLVDLNGSNDNVLIASYQTYNTSDLYDMLNHVEVLHYETSVKVHTSLYRLDYGHVTTSDTFNNLTGSWGYGSFQILFEPLAEFSSGSYTLRTTLLSGETYDIHFTKSESNQKDVTSITYQGQTFIPDTDVLTSYIPYGIYYDSLIDETNIVNFSDLSMIADVYYDTLDLNTPLYLDSLEISNFSTLISVNLNVTQLVDLRYQYDIIYLIQAEDLTTKTFTHRLIESEIDHEPLSIYKNGGLIDASLDVDISYSEAPTIRAIYDLDEIFMPHVDVFQISQTFDPLNVGETVSESKDYFQNFIANVGYELDFNRHTPKGDYRFQLSYQNDIVLWGHQFTWYFEFDELILHKLENDEAKFKDILFVSDTIFSGFNTIMDTEYITTLMYETYMTTPSTRKINVLPTTGIAYNTYDQSQTYYVIGQVQKTNLAAYEPIFYLSDNAMIRKVTDDANLHYIYQSEDLVSDFSPIGDQFNFVHYRVYAEDYDQYPTHYTDYYVAVQDVTNNIRFEINIDNQSNVNLDQIFVTIDICQNEENCNISETLYRMSVYSTYNIEDSSYTQTNFQTTMHGTYTVEVDLEVGLTYSIILEQSSIDGKSFYLEDSILPRKYYLTIIITNSFEENEWGYGHVSNQNE